MPATIREVAKTAGVTIGTVSRAFNGYSDIKPETKERIEHAARILNYVPNVSARSLSAKKPPNIGLMISGLLEGDSRDNSVYLILQGVFEYASAARLKVALYTTDSQEQRRESFTQFCRTHSLSGAILSGMTTDDAYFAELVGSDIPCVAIDIPVSGPKSGWVSVDNERAAGDMTRFLLERGHRNILIMAGKHNTSVNDERLSGVRGAFETANIPFHNDKVIFGDFNEELAYTKTRALLTQYGKGLASAILCFSDIMAMGVIRAVRDSGFSVPDDISVTGFDGVAIGAYVTPPLTTIRQDIRQIGYRAAKLLDSIMNNEPGATHVTIPHYLVERNSVRSM